MPSTTDIHAAFNLMALYADWYAPKVRPGYLLEAPIKRQPLCAYCRSPLPEGLADCAHCGAPHTEV